MSDMADTGLVDRDRVNNVEARRPNGRWDRPQQRQSKSGACEYDG
jgi:hypothetical protein